MKEIRAQLSLIIFALMIMTSSAFAEVTTIEVAKNHLLIVEESRIAEKRSWVEVGLSSWAPSHFTLPAQVGSEVGFERAVLPAIHVNYLMQGNGAHTFNYKMGLSGMGMSRTTQFTSGGFSNEVSQTLTLVSARIGAEYLPLFLRSNTLEPYFSGSILPSAAITGRSVFESGSTYFGFPVEFGVGTHIRLSVLGIEADRADFDLGLIETIGKINSASMNGFGVNGGLRVRL